MSYFTPIKGEKANYTAIQEQGNWNRLYGSKAQSNSSFCSRCSIVASPPSFIVLSFFIFYGWGVLLVTSYTPDFLRRCAVYTHLLYCSGAHVYCCLRMPLPPPFALRFSLGYHHISRRRRCWCREQTQTHGAVAINARFRCGEVGIVARDCTEHSTHPTVEEPEDDAEKRVKHAGTVRTQCILTNLSRVYWNSSPSLELSSAHGLVCFQSCFILKPATTVAGCHLCTPHWPSSWRVHEGVTRGTY